MRGSHEYGILQDALRVMCVASHLCNTRQQELCCCAAVSAHEAAVRGEQSVEMVVFSYMAICDGTSCIALGLQASHLNSEEDEALDWYKTSALAALHIRTYCNGRKCCVCTRQGPIDTSCCTSPEHAASQQMCTPPTLCPALHQNFAWSSLVLCKLCCFEETA